MFRQNIPAYNTNFSFALVGDKKEDNDNITSYKRSIVVYSRSEYNQTN